MLNSTDNKNSHLHAKCQWCQDGGIMEHYHDEEWGIACHDDRTLYEYLMLEAMSCGLSWKLILKKRDILRACFDNFDFNQVALYGENHVNDIMEYPGMIKSHRKIEAMISNARCFIKIREKYGSFDQYIWSYTRGQTYIYQKHLDGEWITKNTLSDEISKDLKKYGFKYLGSTLIYSYMQAIGIINDHEPTCWMFHHIGGEVK